MWLPRKRAMSAKEEGIVFRAMWLPRKRAMFLTGGFNYAKAKCDDLVNYAPNIPELKIRH
jgi:hypothetical protein